MEITTLQIVLVFIVACIAGMGSILDEFQFHRPLIACTLDEPDKKNHHRYNQRRNVHHA